MPYMPIGSPLMVCGGYLIDASRPAWAGLLLLPPGLGRRLLVGLHGRVLAGLLGHLLKYSGLAPDLVERRGHLLKYPGLTRGLVGLSRELVGLSRELVGLSRELVGLGSGLVGSGRLCHGSPLVDLAQIGPESTA
jgi:hypothetical protein